MSAEMEKMTNSELLDLFEVHGRKPPTSPNWAKYEALRAEILRRMGEK